MIDRLVLAPRGPIRWCVPLDAKLDQSDVVAVTRVVVVKVVVDGLGIVELLGALIGAAAAGLVLKGAADRASAKARAVASEGNADGAVGTAEGVVAELDLLLTGIPSPSPSPCPVEPEPVAFFSLCSV